MNDKPPIRALFLVPGMAALLAALWTGLLRLAWPLPPFRAEVVLSHGPLMVCGFLGTVISLERAVALETRLAYAAPLFAGLGALALIAGAAGSAGPVLTTIGSGGLVVLSAFVFGRRPGLASAVVVVGALAWLAGNGLWLCGWPLYTVVPWWEAFLVATIAGERLELSRLLGLTPLKSATFGAGLGLFLVGVFYTLMDFDQGVRITGAGLLGLSAWLSRCDLSLRTVRQPGLPRFMAVNLISGYVWLGVGGLLRLWLGGAAAGPYRDALLHTLFLGFVFAMIFAHAPVIFPSVLRVPVSFGRGLYVPLVLLQLSLALRVGAALRAWLPGQQWGALLNALAIISFLATVAGSLARARSRRR